MHRLLHKGMTLPVNRSGIRSAPTPDLRTAASDSPSTGSTVIARLYIAPTYKEAVDAMARAAAVLAAGAAFRTLRTALSRLLNAVEPPGDPGRQREIETVILTLRTDETR